MLPFERSYQKGEQVNSDSDLGAAKQGFLEDVMLVLQ